jgi:hypothetical protein
MSYGLSDIFSANTLQGAMSGGLAGLATGNPYAAAVGAVGGAGLGSYAGYKSKQATSAANSSLDNAMASINAFKNKAYQQRISDLKQAQSFYGPAISQWNSMYGTGPAKTQDSSSIGLAGTPSSGRF